LTQRVANDFALSKHNEVQEVFIFFLGGYVTREKR